MSSPVPRRITLLSLFLLFAVSVSIPRFVGAVEPMRETTSLIPAPGAEITPAPDVPETDPPSGSDGSDEGHPTDIDQITDWIRNVFGVDWPLM